MFRFKTWFFPFDQFTLDIFQALDKLGDTATTGKIYRYILANTPRQSLSIGRLSIVLKRMEARDLIFFVPILFDSDGKQKSAGVYFINSNGGKQIFSESLSLREQ